MPSHPHNLNRLFATAIVAVLTLSALAGPGQSAAHAQSSYTVTDLGVLSGTTTSRPSALNDTALSSTGTPIVRVVGTTVTSKGIAYHAFYWDSATKTITDIGALTGGQSSTPGALNSLGEVVGSGATTSTGGNARAFYWKPALGAGNLIALSQTLSNTLHNGVAATSNATSINEAGIIVGNVYSQAWGLVPVYWQKDPSSGVYQCIELPGMTAGVISNDGLGAYQINANGDIVGGLPDGITGGGQIVVWKNQSINPLTGGANPANPVYGNPLVSAAADSWGGLINIAGEVAANYNYPTGGGFVWAPDGVSSPQDIGHLGFGNTRVHGLSDNGAVTGESWKLSSGVRHAFMWTTGTGMIDLETLGGASSYGRSVNNAGIVVGVSQVGGSNGANQGFRWDSVGGMRSLNASALTPTKGSFSLLGFARKISDRGYIVGEGTLSKGGTTHAYLLTPKP